MRLSTLNGVGVDLRLVAGRVVAVVLALEDVETEGLAAGRPLRFFSAGDSKARGENDRMGRWGEMGRGQPALQSFHKKCRVGWLLMRLSTLNGVGVDLGLVAGRVVAVVLAFEDVETEGLAAGRPLRFFSAGDSKARGENGRGWGDGAYA
jgi:hypothetical protein